MSGKVVGMDFLPHFRRDVQAFETAVRKVDGDAPIVPSCTGWTVTDLVMHLGWVQRFVVRIVSARLQVPPDPAGREFLQLPEVAVDWPRPDTAPNHGPLPASLADWFAEGAAELADLFARTDPGEQVWTWSQDQTVGFWLRIQAVEAAVHRWDAEGAVGTPQPFDADLAQHAILQHFTTMAPFWRVLKNAPAGAGERFRFRQTDGPGDWTVEFDRDQVRITDGPGDVELAGTASDLLLVLWKRLPAEHLDILGDRAVLDRYFTLVPPV
jgi:uncharacterized protein (TIGR03083 family)